MEGYAPGGVRRASATRSQEERGPAPAAGSHLRGAGNEGTGAHQRGAAHAVSAQPALAGLTGTKACSTWTCGGGGGRSSSSSRYGRNNLNGLRAGSGAERGTNAGCGAGGGVGRRTDRSIGSGLSGSGVGTWTGGVGSTAGGGDGSLALSGEPTEYGGGEGAGCGARLSSAARRAGSACSHF